MPKVSVVIPAYNAERFIKETIDSVLAQTFQDFEILVVDDGSKDKTAEIVNSYGSSPVYLLQKPNGGVSTARNLGISESKGEYIALLDADDLWKPTKLEKQVELLDKNKDIGLCFAGMEKIDEKSDPLNEFAQADHYDDYCQSLLTNFCIISGSCSSVMMRRDLVQKTDGFDKQFSTCADWEYWLRLSLLTKFAPVSEYLVLYREVSGSMSSNPYIVEKDVLGVLEKFFQNSALPTKYKRLESQAYSNSLMILSGEFLHAKAPAKSIYCLYKGLKLCPQNVKRPLGLPIRWTRRLLNL